LFAGSIVIDVGGFNGDWSFDIVRRYDPTVLIFEPIPDFYMRLLQRFSDYPKVRIFNVGLSEKDGSIAMAVAGDASGAYLGSGPTVSVQMRDIAGLLAEEGLGQVDLIKINIEGGEYALLSRMIESGVARNCIHIQVQFHRFIPKATERRATIREELALTHRLVYDYPFVWEGWTRRSS
jgi:FkbM family methyltransferase